MPRFHSEKAVLLTQALRYGAVAVVAQVLDISLFYLFAKLFDIHYLIAGMLAFAPALMLNYVLCRVWVFQVSEGLTPQKATMFLSIALIGLVLTLSLLWLFTSMLGFDPMYSKLVSIVIVFWWNFLARKVFIFNTATT